MVKAKSAGLTSRRINLSQWQENASLSLAALTGTLLAWKDIGLKRMVWLGAGRARGPKKIPFICVVQLVPTPCYRFHFAEEEAGSEGLSCLSDEAEPWARLCPIPKTTFLPNLLLRWDEILCYKI